MKILDKKELKEVIQSGHINLLIGSGCSLNYLDTLGDIENEMNDEAKREEAQKKYYRLIRKSKSVLDEELETDSKQKKELSRVKANYDDFVRFWTEAMFRRSLKIVNKQVNVFSTNFDMFFEDACERLEAPYNDGFAGQLNPVFDVGNFNKIQQYKSLQFDNTSDIPLFNIIKLHGSLSWKTNQESESISYSNGSHIDDKLDEKNGDDFKKAYEEQLAVINPNAEKHFTTVLDTNYASLLRKFTLELEKENSVLFVVGFSLADEHIRKLLYSVMKSNPTLIVVYMSYSQYVESPKSKKDKETNERLEPLMKEESSRSNFYIVMNPDGSSMPFEKTTEYFETILPRDDVASDSKDDSEVKEDGKD